jgi:hypothetical protein
MRGFQESKEREMPTPNSRRSRFPGENMILRFLAGEEHFSRRSPRITSHDAGKLAAQGFRLVHHWDQDRMTDVYRPDDLTQWQTRYDQIVGELPVKRPVGRPEGTPNPNAGRKASKTWEQRHMEAPEGSGTILVTVPNKDGRQVEGLAKQEGLSIPAWILSLIKKEIERQQDPTG